MSANVYWQPDTVEVKCLPTSAPQRFMDTLRALGWNDGGSLTSEHLPGLRALAALHSGVNIQNPYWCLAEAIDKHESIRVWPEY